MLNGFRISPQQRRLWQLQNTSRYRVGCLVQIDGPVDRTALTAAIQETAARHEILRTTYHVPEGLLLPVQVIGEAVPEVDMYEGHIDPNALLQEMLQRPADLAIQAALVAVGAERHVLAFTLPALSADAATFEMLTAFVAQVYAVLRTGAEVPEAPVQYADLAEWQNELLESEDTESIGEYWRQIQVGPDLEAHLPCTEVGALTTSPFEVRSLSIPLKVEPLTALATEEGVPVSTVLLAAWQGLLAQLTGKSDLAVSMAFDGRRYEELKEAPGLFARYLPIRVDAAGLSFRAYLHQLAEVVDAARRRQEHFAWAGLERGFLPFAFDFHQAAAPVAAAGATFRVAERFTLTERFQVELSCLQQDGALRLTFHYDAGHLNEAAARRLAERYLAFLGSAVRSSDTPVSALSAVGPAERAYLLEELNQTATAFNLDRAIHQLVEQQAEAVPDRVAVICEDQRLTYAELNARANQVAHFLLSLGVQPEAPVGLCLERSVDTVVAMLGVLKAGGAYVPFDTALPVERLRFLLQDTGAAIVLTEAARFDLPEGRVVRLDAEGERIAKGSAANPGVVVSPNHLAYILYTSGSTGQPKGCGVEHRNLVNYVLAVSERLDLPTGASYATVSTFAADLGHTMVFPALCLGGTLHVIAQDRISNADAFADYMAHHAVDALKITPSHLRAMLMADRPERTLPRLRLVLGGEATSLALLGRIKELAPDCRVFNHYGPTETTVGVLTYEAQPGQISPWAETLPLGRPLANVRVYVLDEQQQPVPMGVPGELYIGGACVTRGYWNRPELTAERFVVDPFQPTGGDRFYRTGDRVRYLPDGTLEFLGRVDHQVKIRGFRVELGEIESALAALPTVGQAVAVAFEGNDGEKQLVAYVTPGDGGEVGPVSDLRDSLQTMLPPYMVPSAFVVLQAMPLTPNGKIDRKRLPAPERDSDKETASYVAPRTPAEELLAGIWSSLLGRTKVGTTDNFFELGGHSLLATQLIARVRSVFQVEIPLRRLFSTPTIAGMAETIAAARRQQAGADPLPLLPVARDGALPVSFTQQRFYFLTQLDPENAAYNMRFAYRFQGDLDVAVLEKCFNEIIRRHEVLRTTYHLEGTELVHRVAPFSHRTLPLFDLRHVPESERQAELERRMLAETQRPFDLEHGPVLRLTLLQTADQDHTLLLTLHHIVADAWTVGVMRQEVGALYTAFAAGQPSPLPELAIQYADFAHWQRTWLQGEALQAQLDYWKETLKHSPPVLELPTDRPRPSIATYRGAQEAFEVPAAVHERLYNLARAEGATLFMTVLAAFNVLLHRWSGQEDISVGTPIANRPRLETEPLIGCFLNTLVLRTQISPEVTFRQLIQRVQEVCLGAYDHQDIPFEKLVEELQPERALSHTPIFQVMFNLQNTPRQAIDLPGLTMSGQELDNRTSKFDLMLSLVEGPGCFGGGMEYNTDLFDSSTIARMLSHLGNLLDQATANPDKPIADFELMSEAERQQLLVTWNDTARDYGEQRQIHQLFEAQAALTPDAVAVVFEGRQLTYAELNRQANRLAHHLRRLGVGPDATVGIYAHRSPELVVAMVGTLKAGGAYVPVDPGYPKDRTAFMIADASPVVLLTQERLLAELPPVESQVVCLDTGAFAHESDVNLANVVTDESLAYVIYTSGSTGRPKGVMNTHGAIRNRLLWMQDAYQLTPSDRVIQKTPYSFDVSVWEFWWPLLAGAGLVVARPGGHQDSEYLANLIAAEQVTTIHFVPSMLQIFLEDPALQRCTSLKRVICSGEALSAELQERFFAAELGCELHNLYGPTEAAIDVTSWACTPDDTRASVPIGRPIANTQIYMLDRQFRPVPIGVPGELCIGGVNLARGYLKRPDLTADRFIPDPFAKTPGARLYRTGDLARFQPDGTIEYLGRLDHQVKLRGFRIELGEIESALRQHPGVREAVVIVREDEPGDKRLVGYVLPVDPASAPGPAELRETLLQQLPAFMLPSIFVTLTAFPLTPSGKLDRRSLPTPDAARPDLRERYVAPETETERKIAAIWAEVLRIGQVGRNDNFFDLGGHSLLLLQVHGQLQAAFGRQVALVRLFEHPTVGAMAAYLTHQEEAEVVAGSQDRARTRKELMAQRRQRRG